ncbi:sugar ABC transporter ATP-binding protein [Lactonifactor longoviformis]|uniref:Ribose transport system ATP-binding protein n=2 Tax=Lactonifactor TaxID=420345 RepID=A0A1M4WC97_9CLOT|nr:sugar ABC transporter ATP-binding protein [Lactonifactor longoviformis]SHE78770.1 ribose transport system ATP-binding protein [Lactonifactor longoviformis DSM 17459]
MAENIVTCQKIRKSFPGVLALDDVDFELKKGEVHALCGENGAGKSTLIKILTGLYGKDSGRIIYEGNEINFKSVQECRNNGISLIPQEIHLAQDLTVAENVMMTQYPVKHGKVDWNAMREKTLELQKRIGCENHFTPDTRVGDLSMGHQQLIEIMKAISTELKVIAFDEPTSSLSDDETERLFHLIKELKEQGISIIYVSHRLGEIFKVCDRVTVFKDGKYVDTKVINDVSAKSLVALMVGRETGGYLKEKNYTDISRKVLEVEGLCWDKKVKNVSFFLNKGEILGMFGIVGAGRTETARLIFGLEKKERGRIKINGETVEIRNPRQAVKRKLGFVTEDRRGEGLSTVSSVQWNITMPYLKKLSSSLQTIHHKQECDNAQKLSAKLRIKAASLDDSAGSLSGGNQQKIVIAKWLGAESEILIFDEPTRGIDVGAKAEIYRLMEQLASEGKSIIMISSELPELLSLSDRILVYRDGEINKEFTEVGDLTEEQVLHYAIMKDEGGDKL